MSEAGNKMVVTAFVAAMNAGAFDRVRLLFTDDGVVQGADDVMPVDQAIGAWTEWCAGLSPQLEILAIAAEDDEVAVLLKETGRWTGPYQGHDRPSGQEYELVAMQWFQFDDGRISRHLMARDSASQAKQIGLPTG